MPAISTRSLVSSAVSSLLHRSHLHHTLRSFRPFPPSTPKRSHLYISSRAMASNGQQGGVGASAADAGMDAVQRRLMFEDECILVDEGDRVVGHDSKYNSKICNKGYISSGVDKHLLQPSTLPGI